MRLLFCGDIVGRAGRDVVVERLPALKRDHAIDFVVANGENAAGGFGITKKICDDLYGAGVDCITTGNHVWDQKETIGFIGNDARLLRPFNFPAGTPGKGTGIYPTAKGKKVGVINLMGRLFMDPLDDPFQQIEQLLNAHRLGGNCDALILDFHGEATSEKMAMGHVVDGRVSLCVGTHTHVQTADERILPKGTAYITDAGMTGPHESIIGVTVEAALGRFLNGMPAKFEAASGPARLNAIVISADPATGRATAIERLNLSLQQVDALATAAPQPTRA